MFFSLVVFERFASLHQILWSLFERTPPCSQQLLSLSSGILQSPLSRLLIFLNFSSSFSFSLPLFLKISESFPSGLRLVLNMSSSFPAACSLFLDSLVHFERFVPCSLIL